VLQGKGIFRDLGKNGKMLSSYSRMIPKEPVPSKIWPVARE
jgi:hypothetical protein